MKIQGLMLFVKDIEKIATFYEKYFGLKRNGIAQEGYLELVSGGVKLALHQAHGKGSRKSLTPVKIIFYSRSVRQKVKALEKRGLKFGKLWQWQNFVFCDTKDPEGNPIQISNR